MKSIKEKELLVLPKKQIILFAADCARKVLPFHEDEDPDDNSLRLNIEFAESFTKSTKYQLDDLIGGRYYVRLSARYAAKSAMHFKNVKHEIVARSASWCAYYAKRSCEIYQDDSCCLSEFIHDLYHNAFNNGKVFQNNLKTKDAIGLTHHIIGDRDFASSPILADALEDAGCDDDALLSHLRTDIIGLSDWALFSLRQDAL